MNPINSKQENKQERKQETKQDKKLEKLKKKEKLLRTLEERQNEIDKVYNSLEQNNIPHRQLPGFQQFATIANDFIKTGIAFSGCISIPELKKDLLYLLNNNKKHQIIVMLKHNPHLE